VEAFAQHLPVEVVLPAAAALDAGHETKCPFEAEMTPKPTARHATYPVWDAIRTKSGEPEQLKNLQAKNSADKKTFQSHHFGNEFQRQVGRPHELDMHNRPGKEQGDQNDSEE
jgi:hypothetical protein